MPSARNSTNHGASSGSNVTTDVASLATVKPWVGERLRLEMQRIPDGVYDMTVEMGRQARAMEHGILCDHGDRRAKQRRAGAPHRPGWVYVVSAPDANLVKIGCVRQNGLELRLRSLQSTSPIRLNLIALANGWSWLEHDWHYRFKTHRRHGEWFDATEIGPMFAESMRDAGPGRCVRCVIGDSETPTVSELEARADGRRS